MSTTVANPYAADLGTREPVAAMREAVDRIGALVAHWNPAQFERSYAPGKWTGRQILTHLAQTELALGTRARMALTVSNYIAQPFEQDVWIARETRISGAAAAAAYLAMRQMNLDLFSALTPAERETPFTHPEYGGITVDWLVHQLAGHDLNHLKQL